MVPLAVPLLIDSVKRTDAFAIGAELRGFSLRTRQSARDATRSARATRRLRFVAWLCLATSVASVIL